MENRTAPGPISAEKPVFVGHDPRGDYAARMFSSVLKKGADNRSGSDELSTGYASSSPTPSGSTIDMNQGKTALISEDVELKGSLSFNTKLELNGRFEGEILADAPLVIGPSALVKADITSTSSVVIFGKVKGNITAKEQVELKERSQLFGDVKVPRFIVADGATFVGRSDTSEGASASDAEFNQMFSRLSGSKKAAE
jgi:cytoskeletal protein CcmA (bactofilin family)